MSLDYTVADEDLKLVVRGLKIAGRAFLEAGATKVMSTTFKYIPCTTPVELDRLDDYVRDNTDIALQSSHPQGGNAMSGDPVEGVVDNDFRVHGVDRLHVCDASVFPSPITVNPQLTVMALAHMAGGKIE
jgi:choline dehydrogenase-like flavoprotein